MGSLYNDPVNITKQVYLMGTEGSPADSTVTIRNIGKINVGTKEKAVDISDGGILNAMDGSAGSTSTMTNTGDISFYLHADASTDLNSFQSYAMSLSKGDLTNDGNIVYSFSNLDEEGEVPDYANQVLNLSPIVVGRGSGTNNGTISATMKGKALYGSNLTAMMANVAGEDSADLTNNGEIDIDSTVDYLNLTGIYAAGGDMENTSDGKITLKTTANYANLIGMNSSAATGTSHNAGEIHLIHDGGSGSIVGVNGGNSGKINIDAKNMTGATSIIGYGVGGGDSGSNGEVNISLIGTTYGSVVGATYGPSWGKTGTYTFTDDLTITDKLDVKEDGKWVPGALNRAGNISVVGISATTDRPTDDETGLYLDTATATAVNSGNIAINISASKKTTDTNYRTEIYGMYGNDANVTNTGDIKIDVDLNYSANHKIVGMATEALTLTDQEPIQSRAYNSGAITINVTGEKSDTASSDFDVIGMLTNSYALNTGNINIYVESAKAKAAGMVAYDGGVLVNQGTITFTGNGSYTPMYASGTKYYDKVVDEETETTTEGETETTTTTRTHLRTDYYATVYNYGDIIISGGSTTPKGSGYYRDTTDSNVGSYYDPASLTEPWPSIDDSVDAKLLAARKARKATQTCNGDAEACEDGVWEPTDEQLENYPDTYYTITDEDTADITTLVDGVFTPIPATVAMSAPAPTMTAMAATTPTNTTDVEDVLASTNNALSQEISTENIEPTTTQTMLLNDGMKYVSELGGSVVADGIHLLGSVTAGTSLVIGKNADTFVSTGSGNGAVVSDGDASDLTLDSNSAMFKASYAQNTNNSNGLDIVMTRKNFNEIVENDSLASFLENNYQSGNNVAFFDKLKAFSNLSGLTSSLDKITGAGILSRFNFEDMTMMRELNFSMNEQLFHNKEGSFSVAGVVAPMAFKGDLGSKSKYSLFNKRKGNMSIGLGIAFSDVKSDDEHKDSGRHESVYQMIVPIGFKMLGFNLMTSPRLGYARGTYDREGFNSATYNGTVEKRVYGLMNEARYPIDLGSWTLEPAAEFNVLGYTQKGKEDAKDYSLNIKSQNTYSIESGIGLYFLKDKDIGKDRHLKFNAGVAVYHEFADPYKINVGMRGMDGSFQLRDEERSDNRGVLRLGLDYENKDYTVYGSFMSYIDKEVRSNFKSGVKVKF